MKKTSVMIFVSAITAVTLYASFILPPYDKAKPAAMSLPIAYDHAITALGSDTNQFHCVSANITTTFTSEGEWYFSFYSTNSNTMPKFVVVEFNGKVVFDNGYR